MSTKRIIAKTDEDCLYKAYKYRQTHKNAKVVKYEHDKLRGEHIIHFQEGN